MATLEWIDPPLDGHHAGLDASCVPDTRIPVVRRSRYHLDTVETLPRPLLPLRRTTFLPNCGWNSCDGNSGTFASSFDDNGRVSSSCGTMILQSTARLSEPGLELSRVKMIAFVLQQFQSSLHFFPSSDAFMHRGRSGEERLPPALSVDKNASLAGILIGSSRCSSAIADLVLTEYSFQIIAKVNDYFKGYLS